MNDQKQRVLDHLIAIALVDKTYAWTASKHYAELNQYELSEMPEMLKEEMLARKSNAQQIGD